jgi:hypothetical protein
VDGYCDSYILVSWIRNHLNTGFHNGAATVNIADADDRVHLGIRGDGVDEYIELDIDTARFVAEQLIVCAHLVNERELAAPRDG